MLFSGPKASKANYVTLGGYGVFHRIMLPYVVNRSMYYKLYHCSRRISYIKTDNCGIRVKKANFITDILVVTKLVFTTPPPRGSLVFCIDLHQSNPLMCRYATKRKWFAPEIFTKPTLYQAILQFNMAPDVLHCWWYGAWVTNFNQSSICTIP